MCGTEFSYAGSCTQKSGTSIARFFLRSAVAGFTAVRSDVTLICTDTSCVSVNEFNLKIVLYNSAVLSMILSAQFSAEVAPRNAKSFSIMDTLFKTKRMSREIR